MQGYAGETDFSTEDTSYSIYFDLNTKLNYLCLWCLDEVDSDISKVADYMYRLLKPEFPEVQQVVVSTDFDGYIDDGYYEPFDVTTMTGDELREYLFGDVCLEMEPY